ncbi:MAG TPA: hypothetical protein VN193_02415 [Candidatus Angelobacter sp.]|jgi:hypothetical protein|nr:hypothetical protein [Candidatus Angelobacter sp.]
MSAGGGAQNHRIAYAAIAALWVGAVLSFVITAGQGSAAFHIGQVVSGVCIVAAGAIIAVDWLGVATRMGQRSADRWRGRLQAQDASNPVVATRSTRMLAWWWIGFGVLLLILAIAAPR